MSLKKYEKSLGIANESIYRRMKEKINDLEKKADSGDGSLLDEKSFTGIEESDLLDEVVGLGEALLDLRDLSIELEGKRRKKIRND